MIRVSKMKYINIYSNMNEGYIVHNTRKKFHEGHTHINNFNTAKYIAYLVLYKRIPKNKHLSLYLIESIIRVSDDNNYINKIKEIQENELRKKSKK